MEDKDIRWQQRFSNYKKALLQLELFYKKGKDLNHLEEQGLIQCFEYTYELAWNTLKDYLEAEGYQRITGPRTTIMESFKRGLILDGEGWMKMFTDRNRTSHTYQEEIATEIAGNVLSKYYDLFVSLKTDLQIIMNGQGNLFSDNK